MDAAASRGALCPLHHEAAPRARWHTATRRGGGLRRPRRRVGVGARALVLISIFSWLWGKGGKNHTRMRARW
uniref:Uncharacterized protein n=2 Tax=Oryza TaxID=4527 RepID=A0A0D3HG38_9ORYZ